MPRKTHPTIASAAAKPAAEIRRKNVKSPEFVSVYANDVQVQTSPWDVRLILGEIADLGTADDRIVTINQLAELRISPQLAKRMTMMMIEQLKTYEERFGQIPGPPPD